MKSTTIKHLISNYIPPENSNKEALQKHPSQTAKNKNNKFKDIKNPSIKTRRKPKFFNINKNNLYKKKINSSSKTKKLENYNSKKSKLRINNSNNNMIIDKTNKNKSISTETNGLLLSGHDRNLSAPDLKFQSKEEYNYYKNLINKKKNQNIIRLNQKNKKLDDILTNRDKNNKIEDINLIKNKNIWNKNKDKLYELKLNKRNNNYINQLNNKNNHYNESIIKETLPKDKIGDDEENNNFYSFNYLTINNFNKKNNRKKNKTNLLNCSEVDFSHFNKDIKNIKNIQESIALLKEQLKDDKKISNKVKNKLKLNSTIDAKSSLKNKNNNNISKKKNRINSDLYNNFNKYAISNFHNYNQNILNKNGKNNNKVNNTYFSNLSHLSDDVAQNKTLLNTAKNNDINNNNLSNSSNNKTISISTNITNNNGFGKKINLSRIYGNQNEEEKAIISFKENIEIINKNENINLSENNINNINSINAEKMKENINSDISINTEIENIFLNEFSINNKYNKKNSIDFSKTKKFISLHRSIQNKNSGDINIPSNQFSLRNQYNSFKNPKLLKKEKDKNKEKEMKEFHSHSIQCQYQNKNQKNYNKKFNSKMNINNLHSNNTLNNMNKCLDSNHNNFKFNKINNDNYDNFSNYHNNKNKKRYNINHNNKTNISYDNLNNKKKNISKIKFIKNSKKNDNNNEFIQNIEVGIKKRNSCKPNINKNKDKKRNKSIIINNNDNNNAPSNNVKKLTKQEFKYKSIYKIGVLCKAGEIVFGETKTNQDNFFNYLLDDELRFIGVCDGHGEYGHHVSKFLRNYLPFEFEKELKKFYREKEENIRLFQKEISNNDNTNINIQTVCNEDINDTNYYSNDNKNNKNINIILEKMRNIFENSFSRTDKNLSKFCQNLRDLNIDEENFFDVEYSGSTCVSILLKENNINKIYIANVGDSRAIIIKETKNKYWTCQPLSRDHKPTEKDEAQRIFDYNGEIEKIEDDDGNWTGPLRVWMKGSDGPGLAMTRSFGDEVGASVGVVSTPEVGEYQIKEEDRAIIIASDGLWEYMSNKEVTDFVKKINKDDPNFIVNELYKESVNRWKLKDQGIDDITIICILLKNN